MWLLESDGDVFHGKKLWLRPGKKFIFGRTSAEAGGFVVENKTISRKHLVVEVDAIKPGNCNQLSIRSQIILEDLNTKMGTLVNDIQIRGRRYWLENDRNEIKLGQYEKLFRVFWRPVVLSFSFTSKELKANPMSSFSQYLEPLDIKIISDYIRESTTHVVAKKRNISKCLQALINGKYIIDHTFIDAIIGVTQSKNDEISSLESDFESNWPKELEHLPPRGSETIERSCEAYAPDPAREAVFDGYTFIFCDQSQFENLLGPITNGRGKALLRQVDPSVTKLEDFIRYAKNVAGEKGLGEFEDGSEGKGVVVVRYQPAKGPASDWYANFARHVALSLDHRLVEQNEFLDAILNNNASMLRKPLEIEPSNSVAPLPSVTTMTEAPHGTLISAVLDMVDVAGESTNISTAPNQPPRRMGRSRRNITSRFKGFDDNSDIEPLSESVQGGYGQALPIETQGLFVSQSDYLEPVQQSAELFLDQTRSSRRRNSDPTTQEGNEEDTLDQLAPAATSLKRRRLANDLARKSRGESSPPRPVIEAVTEGLVGKSKKTKPEIDVLEIARQQREKEEEIARVEREALQEVMDGMDIEQIRNLAIIEEIDVQRSAPPPGKSAYADQSNRWDDQWNGRKNFKKFRRRGEGGPKNFNKVIVPLEEVKQKNFGIGDEYWLEGEKDTPRKKKGKNRQRDTQSQPVDISQITNTALGTNTQSAQNAEELDLSTLQPKATRSQKLSDMSMITPTDFSQKKRVAEPMTKPAPTKKVRAAPRRQDSDESDDGLGFRFKKKRLSFKERQGY